MSNIIEEKWNEILDFMMDEYDVSRVPMDTWIYPLQIISFEDSVLTLQFPGESIGADIVRKKYSLILQVSIEEITGVHCTVNIVDQNTVSRRTVKKVQPFFSDTNLNPKYTFDTFVVGNNNRIAHAASLAVAESPGEDYNPLFIYGGAGLGKTHLMQSIANFILKNNASAKVMYVTSENFTNELIDAIRKQKSQEFHEKYRSVDVLLIDDIQFIINKESTQQEVFHTFNTLFEANKAIVLSSDRPPIDLKTLDDRLRSRFGSGFTVDIGLPDFETRMAILRKKEEMEGYNIDDEVIQYIAANIVSNIRDLEGALTKVTRLSALTRQEITLELAKDALKDHIKSDNSREVTPQLVLEIVAEHFNMRVSDLTSTKKDRKISDPRQIAMYLIREITGDTYVHIAKLLNKKDHSTIMHGVEAITQKLESDENLKNTVDIIKKKINPS